jgi:hypothetical protein
MTKQMLKKMIESKAVQRKGERRLTCSQALKIAEECKVEPSVVGALCDEMGIKIRRCRLGCF